MTEAIFSNLAAIISAMGTIAAAWFAYNQYTKNKLTDLKIEQFKKEEKTVYETARTSMEDLANRGFYRKLQIGKKFVYTPIPLKEIND